MTEIFKVHSTGLVHKGLEKYALVDDWEALIHLGNNDMLFDSGYYWMVTDTIIKINSGVEGVDDEFSFHGFEILEFPNEKNGKLFNKLTRLNKI